jgi:hypothetical protein
MTKNTKRRNNHREGNLQLLKWILELLATDLENIKVNELGIFLYHSMHYFPYAVRDSGEVESEEKTLVTGHDNLLFLQQCLREVTSDVFDAIEEAIQKRDSEYNYWKSYKFSSAIGWSIRSVKFDRKYSESEYNEPVFHINESADSGFKDEVLVVFLRCLQGTPLSYFRVCLECGHWHLKTTKKEKRFCSQKCAARYGARKKRHEQKTSDRKSYEEEKKKARGRSRKSYVSRVKAKNPNAVVGSRPRKEREE